MADTPRGRSSLPFPASSLDVLVPGTFVLEVISRYRYIYNLVRGGTMDRRGSLTFSLLYALPFLRRDETTVASNPYTSSTIVFLIAR